MRRYAESARNLDEYRVARDPTRSLAAQRTVGDDADRVIATIFRDSVAQILIVKRT